MEETTPNNERKQEEEEEEEEEEEKIVELASPPLGPITEQLGALNNKLASLAATNLPHLPRP
ncbi:hypothetical protein E2C01_054555 [Portunus trituberculatus]|uniref:Uncharacterized protein n=1 Tax=Portunus trituberculatus TaxID=210409 RepID=A0A5B7GU06_PORTR|nr:hypothetical protein [Portunus trituberculatus]